MVDSAFEAEGSSLAREQQAESLLGCAATSGRRCPQASFGFRRTRKLRIDRRELSASQLRDVEIAGIVRT
jgi:hypothetical protein